MNTAIVKIGVELREFARVATWVVPLTQWLYFAWSFTGAVGAKYWFPDRFNEAFILAGFLLTSLCLLIALIFFVKYRSVKNLIPLVLNASWIGFPVFALMMGWGH